MSIPVDSDWTKDAECLGEYELFDAASTTGGNRLFYAASAICEMCPVRSQCFADAVANEETEMYRAGMSPRDWRKMIRQKKVA